MEITEKGLYTEIAAAPGMLVRLRAGGAAFSCGMMLPGMAAGWIQETIGYQNFFLWTMVCCLATIGVTYLIRIDPSFGRKKQD